MLIWRVNLREQGLKIEAAPEHWRRLGGRGLSAQILLDEVPPTCEPLGRFNKLVFAPGLLVGHGLSSCDRVSIGAKSPLTGGVKESNAGGTTGLQMAALGMQALILEEQSELPGWMVLHLSPDGAQFVRADELAGLGVEQAAAQLRRRYGKKAALALIGPAGEMKLGAAGIQNLDKEGRPSRIAARGGLGAVMGSKGLKAIVFEAAGRDKAGPADPAALRRARQAYLRALAEQPQTRVYHDYGTAAMTLMCNSLGALPTRNFSQGQFEQAEAISGEALRRTILARCGEGEAAHACMPGCTIQSSNVYADVDGKTIVSPLEYETLGLMGANLGIGDLDSIARLNHAADDLGLDTIELGAALGVACEAGLMAYGDAGRALELLSEIRAGAPLGRLLGSGAALSGKTLSVRRVPVVKGQAMSAYEPRAIKGTGVTYATSPQGADHTCGLTIRAKVDHLSPQGQAALSRNAQINMAGYDTLGACIFAAFGFAAAPELIPALLGGIYGWEAPADALQRLGKTTLKLEREFNRRAGFGPQDDRLPEYMQHEPLPPHQSVFDVSEADLDSVFAWDE